MRMERHQMVFGKRVPSGQPGLERRRSPRQATDAVGEILTPGKPPQRCHIVNISDKGACLKLSSIFGIANAFELRAFGRIHRAKVVRKLPGTLYVKFG